MEFPEEIKRIRQKCFFTQHDFAKEIQVAFSTVNRWEGGKAKPNLTAMKNIKEFCLRNDIEYASVEEAWLLGFTLLLSHRYIVECLKDCLLRGNGMLDKIHCCR